MACALLSNVSRATSCSFGPSNGAIFQSNIGDARKLIHERKVPKLGCLRLAKNYVEVILDDGKLDDTRSDYLVALRDDFLPIRRGASFHVEPYSPHWFSRQFGFCQRIPGVLLEDLRSRIVLYEDALTTGRGSYS